MSNNTTPVSPATDATEQGTPNETPEQAKARVVAAATDEAQAVAALAAAGWPGRTAADTLAAARKLAAATGRLAGKAAEEELAKAAAKAAGATGLAAHDRDRIAGLYVGDNLAAAAAATAPTREGTARALVWFVAAIDQAEAEALAE